MSKHAYLIIAHADFDQLAMLLSCLDDARNDIFLHIDKKAKCDFGAMTANIRHSNVYFTKRCKVNWGGYSLIDSELILLEAATQQGEYIRYHLLSGVDFPLRTQDEIHQFFDSHENVEFLDCSYSRDPEDLWFADRIRYFYPFQECFTRNNLLGRVLRKGFLCVQKCLKVDRLRKSDMVFGIGSNWFSITDRFARHVVSQKKAIHKQFHSGLCVDELFLPWVYLHWENPNERYTGGRSDHPYIEKGCFDICRAIDFTRGCPYTYTEEDYDMLMETGCLFARKIYYQSAPNLVRRIMEKVGS